MAMQKSRATRVRFDMGYTARIMAIDGTWFRDCYAENISETGARISISGTLEGLHLGEFFLVLSHTGTAHRRCRMVWMKGETMGVRFDFVRPMSSRASRALRPSSKGEAPDHATAQPQLPEEC